MTELMNKNYNKKNENSEENSKKDGHDIYKYLQ